jgi:hypothetical protein
VSIDGRPGGTGDFADLVDADTVETTLEEQLLGSSQDLFVARHLSSFS